MPHENPINNDEQANAIYKALMRAGRKREKEKGWPRNNRGVHSVLTETSLTILVVTLRKSLNKIGYQIVPIEGKKQR